MELRSVDNLKLPDFIICGVQKAGTTSFHYYLSQHPGIFMGRSLETGGSEIHYFDHDENYEKGLKWYSSHFDAAGKSQIIGQKSPLYIYQENVPGRISKALKDVKLIFLFRDPVERAYSSYWHEKKYGREDLGFEEAIKSEPARISGSYDSFKKYSYISRGFYGKQIENYLKYFNIDRMLFLSFEDMKEDPQGIMDKAFRFLEVDSIKIIPEKKNVTYLKKTGSLKQRIIKKILPGASSGEPEAYKPLDDTRKKALYEIFKEDDVLFSNLTGIKFKREYLNN